MRWMLGEGKKSKSEWLARRHSGANAGGSLKGLVWHPSDKKQGLRGALFIMSHHSHRENPLVSGIDSGRGRREVGIKMGGWANLSLGLRHIITRHPFKLRCGADVRTRGLEKEAWRLGA